MEDLQWLRESGMEALILKAAAKGTLVFGICGGYQMLGESLSDPYGVEAGGTMRGMGLLPMDTVFAVSYTHLGKPEGNCKASSEKKSAGSHGNQLHYSGNRRRSNGMHP